jgi:hypothetical protein
LMTGYLNEIGIVRDSAIAPGHDTDGSATRASLSLYDLSDSTRFRSTSTTHAITHAAVDTRLRCVADLT